MAIFIARISRGRSIRQIVIMLAIAAPLLTNFWFTIIGGAGISFEIATPGIISGPFEGFNLPAGLLAITQAMPSGLILSVLFLVLTMLFVATTSDSMSYVIAASMSKGEPATVLRAFWGLSMGVMALILISTGAGGIGKLQSFIVITAVPVSLILLPSLWDAVRITLMLGRAQKEKTQPTPAE
jgi:glycine betaine transporter